MMNEKMGDLFGPGNFRDVEVLGQAVQMLVEFFHSLFVCGRRLFMDTFFLLRKMKIVN